MDELKDKRVRVTVQRTHTVRRVESTEVTLLVPGYAGPEAIEKLAIDFFNGPGRDNWKWIGEELAEEKDTEMTDYIFI